MSFQNLQNGMSGLLPPDAYSPLVLAYLGDAVFELYVRTFLCRQNAPVHTLHKLATGYVKAKAQSEYMAVLEPLLTEQELSVYKRGRNAKSATVPKNASVTDYRRATGFEALVGYLYISDETDRLESLLGRVLR